MIPLMGFGQLSLFGGYALYFPELFPTRLRSTGTSFCYNVGRFVAASGPAALDVLRRERVSAVVTDLMMPKMMGDALTEAVHAIRPLGR